MPRPVWFSMSLAPRDGTMIDVCIIDERTGEPGCVPACWMAPGGAETLEGWWAAGAVKGSLTHDGLPHRFDACAIIPACWRPRQQPEARTKIFRRLAALRPDLRRKIRRGKR